MPYSALRFCRASRLLNSGSQQRDPDTAAPGDGSEDGISRRIRSVRVFKNSPLGATTEVDHIVPLEDGGAMFDEANLQGLCKSHHSSKTARDKANANNHPLGRGG